MLAFPVTTKGKYFLTHQDFLGFLFYSHFSFFEQFIPLTNIGKKRLHPSLYVFYVVPITCFPRRKKGFRGASRRPWVPNRPSSGKNRQHHEGVQSVGLLLPTPSMNRLGALLCSSIQGSVSLQVLINFKKKRDNFTVGRPTRYHLIHIIKVNITINKHINVSYPNVML